jgi:hypothetical protein
MSPSPRSPEDLQRQHQRKVERQLQDESAWLQKLLFTLDKLDKARSKLAQQQPLQPLIVLDDGTPVPIGLVSLNVRRRANEVMRALGQGPHNRLPS